MEHWLGNATIDRLVLRAVKQASNAGCRPITAIVQNLAHTEKLIALGQKIPSEDDVYVSLLRLVQRGRVERYVDIRTGGIRYCARVYYG